MIPEKTYLCISRQFRVTALNRWMKARMSSLTLLTASADRKLPTLSSFNCSSIAPKEAPCRDDMGLLLVRHAWRLTRRCKSAVEVCSYQPLAKSKGVHREVESEGSWRQNSDPRNTNIIRHQAWDELAKQSEVQSTTRT